MLMPAALWREGLRLQVIGETARPFIDMTLRMMEAWGAGSSVEGDVIVIPGGQSYRARRFAIEPDASGASYFAAAAALTGSIRAPGPASACERQLCVDPFNVFLVALTAFVGWTTALFSRPYMRVETDHGRLTPGRLRLYHSMYQLFVFTMLLVLTTNNLGIMWVATEAATLAGAEGPEGLREPDSDYSHDRDFVDDTRPTPGADPEDTDGRTTT